MIGVILFHADDENYAAWLKYPLYVPHGSGTFVRIA